MMAVRGLCLIHRSLASVTVMMEQGLFIEGGDHHIYKLSHLPMLQSFNRRPGTSGFRYEKY